MADVKITDLVEQSTIDKIKELNTEMQNTLTTYTTVAKDLAKGIDVPVKGLDDLEKLQNLLAQKSKEAATSTEQLNRVVSETRDVLGRTTAVVAENLQNQNKLNREIRQSKVDYAAVMDAIDKANGSYEQHVARLIEIDAETKKNKKSISEYQKLIDMGRDKTGQYAGKIIELTAYNRNLAVEKAKLNSLLKAEEKEMAAAQGSYSKMAQQLEVLKKIYKDIDGEHLQTEESKKLLETINQLDTELKHMAENMGEHQRNVGDYAIALSQGNMSLQEFNNVLGMNCTTMNDVLEQNKQLEDARRRLNSEDSNYEAALSAINAQLEENKAKLADVSDIMDVEAKTVSEAEAQNKRLQEALKYVDLTAADAQQRIDELNHKIDANNAVIEKSTSTTEKKAKAEKEAAEAAKKLADEEKKAAKEAEQWEKKNEGLADSLLSLVGVNSKFGSSLKGLGEGGSFIDGLNTKTQAFGKTLLGLVSNPWVLAFLGIAAVGMAVKWWYDYNKGLIEASRLTENFTGQTGDAADKITSDMQAIADHMGKSYDETIGAANTLVQQFGLSWQEAMDLMKDGIQAGADMSGNMIANIERFGPALRDAGVSADEFMAILSETRNGIFNEEGVQNIMKAGTRLRAMTKQTSQALEDVGISAEKMQKDLESGNLSMLDAVKQVSEKLKELPENSQEAGNIIKNVFGRTAAEGGTQLLQSIADVNTKLDEQKEKMGELGEVNREQMEAQTELNETLNAVFKMSGTSFETMTARAKTFIIQGITNMIKGLVDIVNWFIELYNESTIVRLGVQAIITTFKNMWTITKNILSFLGTSFKNFGNGVLAIAKAIEDVFTGNWDKIGKHAGEAMDAFTAQLDNLKNTIGNIGEEIGENYLEGIKNALSGEKLEKVSVGLDANLDVNNPTGDSNIRTPAKGTGNSEADKKEAEKKAKEAEKAAKEELKRINDLEEAKIGVMEEGHEKELALIRHKFKKKIDEIKGEGDTQIALRLQLAEQCEHEVAQCELKYQKNLAKINLDNRLAMVKEGSKEELTLKLAMIEAQRAEEIEAAKKTGADVALINAKFDQQRDELQNKYAAKRAEDLANQYAGEEIVRDKAYADAANALKARYAEELKLAGNNAEQKEKIEQKYQNDMAELNEQYAVKTARATVKMLEETLALDNLSAEDREKFERQLVKAKIDLENEMADASVAAIKRTTDADSKARDKRIENAQKWLQVASEACSAINDLVSTVYDAKIEKVEEEQEQNEAAGEAEQERISNLVEQNVITEEEGEARKRAAEAKTAKKNEELEKKKQQLQYKQAVWDKANSIAQVGINTAMAIMQTAANMGFPAAIPFIAV
ncbi:MAG: phage tail tape measure protein, partial [Muribaculum sp.]|nr:phage tail tape measure protein [Muribaculum sp.]